MTTAQDFDQLLSVSELATRINRSQRSTLYLIHKMEKEYGGIIIRTSKGARAKVFTTLAAIKRHFPHWFDEQLAPKHEVRDLSREVADLRKRLNAVVALIRDLRTTVRSVNNLDQSNTHPNGSIVGPARTPALGKHSAEECDR